VSRRCAQEQERKSRIKGLEAQKANIRAAKAVARVMRSSMGPKGMDKMLQSPDGDIVISARFTANHHVHQLARRQALWYASLQ